MPRYPVVQASKTVAYGNPIQRFTTRANIALVDDTVKDPPTQLAVSLLARRVMLRKPGADLQAESRTDQTIAHYIMLPVNPQKKAKGPYSSAGEALASLAEKVGKENPNAN